MNTFCGLLDGSTHPCSVEQCAGGVGRNMAEALWRLRGGRVRLLTAIGDDADGEYIANTTPGLLLDGCVVEVKRTATYAAVLDAKGECRMGLGDMAVHDHITPALVERHLDVLKQAPLVVFDGNIPQSTMEYVWKLCDGMKKPVFFEPTDRRKAIKPLQFKPQLTYATPNLAELRAMSAFICPERKVTASTELSEILQMSRILSDYIEFIIITMGSKGVVTVRKTNNNLEARLYPVQVINHITNVSGAGDCFSSGFIYGVLLGYAQNICLSIGFQAAKSAILSPRTVPNDLHVANFNQAEYNKLDMGQ